MRYFFRLTCFFVFWMLICKPSFAAITFDANGKWETTFDCTEQINTDTYSVDFNWDCDGIEEGVQAFGTKFNLSDGSTNNWTQSKAYPNQYYYSGSQLVSPNDKSPSQLTLNGYTCWGSPSYPRSSPLSENEFTWEDNDSLGSSTIYIYSLVDPDTQADGYVVGWFSHKYYEEGDETVSIISAANNPLGKGRGVRFIKGDGKNGVGSGNMSVTFPSAEPELWIRWYAKFQKGFEWRSISQDKLVYLYTGGVAHFVGWYGLDSYSITSQEGGASYTFEARGNTGWNQIMVNGGDGAAGKKSDGEWHCFELHVKMDTGETEGTPNLDGEAEIWIDGTLVDSNKTAYLSFKNALGGSDPDALAGWTHFIFDSNQDFPENGDFMTVDWDDIVIYKTTPPNKDAHGNPFIGPIYDPDFRRDN